LEPLQPEFPWRTCLEIDTLPEAQLIYATISQAWDDSTKVSDCPIRKEARRWFFSERFEYFCHLINVFPLQIQKYVSQRWSS
jgi:hypothetical protein